MKTLALFSCGLLMSGCLYQPCSVEETLKVTERAIMRELTDNINLTQTQMTSLSNYLITLATIRIDWHNLTHEEQIALPPTPELLPPDSGSIAPMEVNLEIYDEMNKKKLWYNIKNANHN